MATLPSNGMRPWGDALNTYLTEKAGNISDLQSLTSTGRLGDSSLKTEFAARWQPNTAYTVGTPVVAPGGETVVATTTHTSGATYSGTGGPNWALPTAVTASISRSSILNAMIFGG